jgi:GNAT superfamily N-acetyltransferase
MATDPIRIRHIEPADRPRWQELWDGYLRFYETDLPAEITEHTWHRLIDPSEQPYGLVATRGERIVGLVHYHFHLSTWTRTGYCYLEDLFVDPAARGGGIGRALIEAVYAAADRKDCSRVYWHTQEHNARARILYDKVARLSPFVQYRRVVADD